MPFKLPTAVFTISVGVATALGGMAVTSAIQGTNTNQTSSSSASGEQGPQGPIGATGPMGPQGPAGPMGPAGAVGAQGPMGPTGPQGIAGAPGAIGPQGPIGTSGTPGSPGANGANGANGATGAIGPQGPTGAQGEAGAQGPTGATGSQGATGAIGPTGPIGATGPQGPMGIANASAPLVYNSTTQSVSLDQDGFDHLGSLGFLQFNVNGGASDSPGRLLWNNEDGTLNLQGKGGGVTLQIGQESVQLVANQTGAAISDGQIVRVIGSANGRMLVALADNGSALGATGVIGLATQNIADQSQGYVTTYGVVHGQNTMGMAAGEPIYLNGGGNYTSLRPTNGRIVQLGYVLVGNSGSGSIYVNPQASFDPTIGSPCVVPGQTGAGTYEWANLSQGRYFVVCKY